MDAVAIICIVVGILIIVMRAPLIFEPSATLRFYDRVFLSTNARLRAFGVVLATVAIALLLLPFGEGALAGFPMSWDGSRRLRPSGSWSCRTACGDSSAPYSASSRAQGATRSCASSVFLPLCSEPP